MQVRDAMSPTVLTVGPGHTIRQEELDRDWRSTRGLWGPVRRGRR